MKKLIALTVSSLLFSGAALANYHYPSHDETILKAGYSHSDELGIDLHGFKVGFEHRFDGRFYMEGEYSKADGDGMIGGGELDWDVDSFLAGGGFIHETGNQYDAKYFIGAGYYSVNPEYTFKHADMPDDIKPSGDANFNGAYAKIGFETNLAWEGFELAGTYAYYNAGDDFSLIDYNRQLVSMDLRFYFEDNIAVVGTVGGNQDGKSVGLGLNMKF